MATLTVNWLPETIEAVETEGALTSMRATALVTGLTDGDLDIIQSALTAVDASIAANSSPNATSNLILKTRTPSLLPNQQGNVKVACEWVSRAESEYGYVFRVVGSLAQIQSEVDRFGNQITVSHTYPNPNPANSEYAGQTIVQGGTISVMMGELTAIATGIESIAYPDGLVAEWLVKTNSTSWRGFGSGQWLCTNVQHQLHNYKTSPKKYKFTFEFQLRRRGWNEQVVFVDPVLGRPPSGLVAGVGIKTPVWYAQKDFNTKFPSI